MIKRNSDWQRLPGYMLRYIYFLNKGVEKSLSCSVIDFSEMPNEIKMYKGVKRVEHESNVPDFQSGEGGAIPTDTLHLKGDNGTTKT